MTPIYVKIVGTHPHSGKQGKAVALRKCRHGILPPIIEVHFPEGGGCYAKKENLKLLKGPPHEQ